MPSPSNSCNRSRRGRDHEKSKHPQSPIGHPFNLDDARKDTEGNSGKSITSPDLGFLTERAARNFLVNVPNPRICTEPSCTNPAAIALSTAEVANSAALRVAVPPRFRRTTSRKALLFIADILPAPLSGSRQNKKSFFRNPSLHPLLNKLANRQPTWQTTRSSTNRPLFVHCACGEIGRRARLRIWCCKTCRFDSCQAHQYEFPFSFIISVAWK